MSVLLLKLSCDIGVTLGQALKDIADYSWKCEKKRCLPIHETDALDFFGRGWKKGLNSLKKKADVLKWIDYGKL